MSVAKKLLLRILTYIAVLGYMVLDIMMFHGPLSRTLKPAERDPEELLAEAKADGVVARVYTWPIYRAQVEEGVRERLWRQGRELADLAPGEHKLLREAVLADLVDEMLIKIQVKFSGRNEFLISEEEKEEAVERFNARFKTLEERDGFMAQQGWKIGESELEMRLAGRIQREKYLVAQLRPWNQKEQIESAESWYEKNKPLLKSPDGKIPEFDEVKSQVEDAQQVLQREKGMADFRKILRDKAKGKIHLFRGVLHGEEE